MSGWSVQYTSSSGTTWSSKITLSGTCSCRAPLTQAERYTYVFEGNSQVLDHILLSPALSAYAYDIVHVNAEFATQVSDHDPQVARLTF